MTPEMLRSLIETNETMRWCRLQREAEEQRSRRMTRAELDDFQKDYDDERQYGWGIR